VFKYISDNEYRSLETMLEQEGEKIDVTQLKESRMYTALSFSAFKNHQQCFKIVLNHARKYNIAGGEAAEKAATTAVKQGEFTMRKRKDLSNWVNMPTDERFSALHFSTYHGNIELIRIMVEEMGADYTTKNVYGANVLHVAAQGDQPCPLYYFVALKDMDINVADNRGSTPLHWACYSKAEFALSYILAMGPDLEIVD